MPIPLHFLPDELTYAGPGEDYGDGPAATADVPVRGRVERKTKLLTYAEGRTAEASDFLIVAPQNPAPELEGHYTGGPLDGPRRVMAVETLREVSGQVHHHEVWVG